MAEINYKVPSKKTVKFFADGLKDLYPDVYFAKDSAVAVSSRKPFSFSINMSREDFVYWIEKFFGTRSMDYAAELVKEWETYYQKLEAGEISPEEQPDATVPENMDELVESYEEELEKKETTRADLESKNKQLQQQLEKQAQLNEQENLTPLKTAESAVPETTTKVAEVPPPSPPGGPTPTPETPGGNIGIKISPATTKGVTSFFAKAAFSPIKFVMDVGSAPLAETPGGAPIATGTQLAFGGISYKQIQKGLGEAQNLSAESIKRLERLSEIVKRLETGSPTMARLAQRANPISGVSFVDLQKIGVTQAQVYSLMPSNTYIDGQQVSSFSFRPNFFSPSGVLQYAGKQLFGKAASAGIKRLAARSGIATAAKAAGKKVISKITAAIGSIEGPLGTLVGYIVGTIGEKVLGKAVVFAKKYGKYILGVPLVVGGFLVGGTAGLGMTGAGSAALLWPSGGLSALRSGATNAFSFFTRNLFLPSIGPPLLFFFVVTPLTIALMLFIINTGAYVVPPADFAPVAENPYIGVTKEAEPAGPFDNDELPQQITYTITVTAKKGTLTNISFEHKCEVIKEGGTDTCDSPFPTDAPTIISPVEPYTFTYTTEYDGSKFFDSLILNTFSVTADTDEVSGTTASGASSIIVGDPPTACFTPVGNWPGNYESNLRSAIAYLTSNHTPFVAKVCRGGTVEITYDSSPSQFWGWASSSGKIILYSGGLGNTTNATYILTHEAGHILSWRLPGIMQQYLDTPGMGEERPMCSYSATSDPYEAFAESAALYGGPKTFSCMNFDFQSTHPNHWEFADSVIFRQYLD